VELYAGLDLHSRNTCIGIMGEALTAFKITCQCLDFQILRFSYGYFLAILGLWGIPTVALNSSYRASGFFN